MTVTATILAAYQYFQCHRFLFCVLNPEPRDSPSTVISGTQEQTTHARCQAGLDWEDRVYSWLDAQNLLLRWPMDHLDSNYDALFAAIIADDRAHFFITGIAFTPPREMLDQRFWEAGSTPWTFGRAKPDLVEIMRSGDRIMWRIVDVKASRSVQTSHLMQIHVYVLCLRFLFSDPIFHAVQSAGIWLPPRHGCDLAPRLHDIHYTACGSLEQAFNYVIFDELPKVLEARSKDDVRWHYNPLCRTCPFRSECKPRAQLEGRFGAMPNIPIADKIALDDSLNASQAGSTPPEEPPISDIEELHKLSMDQAKLAAISQARPKLAKKLKRILALPPKRICSSDTLGSPVVEAARTRKVQVKHRRSYTCPRREDIAIIIVVAIDASKFNLGQHTFCVDLHSSIPSVQLPPPIIAGATDFIPHLAEVIRTITASQSSRGRTMQFYMYSTAEFNALQSHLIEALRQTPDSYDVQLCAAALCEGPALLHTTFQPMLLGKPLLDLISRGDFSKPASFAFATRSQLQPSTDEAQHRHVDADGDCFMGEPGSDSTSQSEKQPNGVRVGELPRVVVLQKEIPKQLAIPSPGFYELAAHAENLLPQEERPENAVNDIIYLSSSDTDQDDLHDKLTRRTHLLYAILGEFRRRAVAGCGCSFLVNDGVALPTIPPEDLCRNPHIRKLFYMHMLELKTQLAKLWQSRLDGCPDAVILEYVRSEHGEDIFLLVSGTIDTSAPITSIPNFDNLLVKDSIGPTQHRPGYEHLPAEALFNDISFSGISLPQYNEVASARWREQHPRVQSEILLAGVRKVVRGPETLVFLQTWGDGNASLQTGSTYRLSNRLNEINIPSLLRSLFEIDLSWGARAGNFYPEAHRNVPFLRLIMDPNGELSRAHDLIDLEGKIQKFLTHNEAGSLVLKPSQHQASQQIISNQFSVIWGPPGTGKTHTITLSLLRLLAVEHHLFGPRPKIVVITAATHAAVEACCDKLSRLMDAYRSLDQHLWSKDWLEHIKLESVDKGVDHPAPETSGDAIHIYAGTVYQLGHFMQRHSIEVDCVIIDEAGQISLAAASLVVRFLSNDGRIVIAGDCNQLAPILSNKYPQLQDSSIFGSVLDCLMFLQAQSDSPYSSPISHTSEQDEPMAQGAVVQLTENFRLNPDLGAFISTIYARQFQPQKAQLNNLADLLEVLPPKALLSQSIFPAAARSFFVSLTAVMRGLEQKALKPPSIPFRPPGVNVTALAHTPMSMTMIRLKTLLGTKFKQDIPYKDHIRAEAALAVALLDHIRRCCPDDDIFVATPLTDQRDKVKRLLHMLPGDSSKVKVDSIESLQGLEASFVICLFSLPRKEHTSNLSFFLDRRRLNVAISRAKTLCIVITSEEVLKSRAKSLANEDIAKGYEFMKEYAKRAWSYELTIDVLSES